MAVNFTEVNKLTIDMVNYKLKDVLLNALYETVCMFSPVDDELEAPDEYIIPENINTLKEELKSLITELPQQLKLSADNRADYISRLSAYRSRLIDDFYGTNLYLYRLQQIKDLYERQAKLLSIDFETNNINSDAFLSYVQQLTSEVKKLDGHGPYMLGELMSLFPLRMTKAKYSDYIKLGLSQLFDGLNGGFLENTLKMFKAKINPTIMPEYGKYSDLIGEEIKAYSQVDISTLNADEVMDNIRSIEDTEENIGFILNLYSLMYNIVVYITALSQYCISDDYIFEDDLRLKDMLYATIDMLKADDPEIFAQTLEENIGDMIEELFDEFSKKEKKLNKTLDKLAKLDEKDIPEDTVVAVNVYTALIRTFVVEIIDELSGIDNDEESTLTISEAVNEIAEFVETSLDNYTLSEQKLIKQKLLGDMPSPLSAEECYEYMAYAFEGISDNKMKLVCIGNVLETTDPEDDDYDECDDDECDCGHEHHHEHDCDCGHEHHHEHDYDCGHEHHHEHDCGYGHHHH